MRHPAYIRGFILWLTLFLAVPAAGQQHLKIDGTGDSQTLLRALAMAFETANPGVRVEVPDSIGSSGGVKSLVKGFCDLARVARPLKAKERAKAPDLQAQVFARSPVVFVANLPERCVDNLTSDQLVGIFSGEISNWSQLGNCPAHKIYVAKREAGDSSRSVVKKKLPALADIRNPVGQIVYSTPETVETLENHAYTFGYLPQAIIRGQRLQVFSVDGVAPTQANVLNGRYALSSQFGLVWNGDLSGLAADFVKFVSSPEGEKVILAAQIIPATAQ